MSWSLLSPLVFVLYAGYPSVRVKFNFSNLQQNQLPGGNSTEILLDAGFLGPAKGLSSWEEAWLSK